MTLPPLSNEQHARLVEAKRYLNQGIAALDLEQAPLGFMELCLHGALRSLVGMESGVGRALDRTEQASPPVRLHPVPPVEGSPSIDPLEAA